MCVYIYLFMNHIWRSIISPCIWSMYQICRDQATRTKKGQPKGVGSFQVILAGVTHSWNVPKTHQKSSWNDDMKWYEMISAISHHHNIENDHLRIMKCMIWNELYIMIWNQKNTATQRPCYQGQGPRLWWRQSLANWSFAWPPQKRNIETSSPTCFQSFFCNRSEKIIQPESNLELVATGLIVIWQHLLRGPPTCDKEWSDSLTVLCLCSLWGLCVYHQTRGSQAMTPQFWFNRWSEMLPWLLSISSNFTGPYMLQNVTKCATSTTSTTSTWRQSWCFRTKGQVSQVFSRKQGSNHGEVRGTANQLDDMLEPRLIAAQALHIQGNNKYAVKWPV